MPGETYAVTLGDVQWKELMEYLAFSEDHATQEAIRYSVMGRPGEENFYRAKAKRIRLLIVHMNVYAVVSGP